MTVIIDNEPARDSKNRSIDFVWPLQDLGEDVTEQLVLSASHDGDRKCFYATLHQQTHEQTPHGSRIGFMIFGGVTVAREPVARFNQKRLDEFADTTLAALRASDVNGTPEVAALLTPSDRSCGCTGMHHKAGCEVYAASVRARTGR